MAVKPLLFAAAGLVAVLACISAPVADAAGLIPALNMGARGQGVPLKLRGSAGVKGMPSCMHLKGGEGEEDEDLFADDVNEEEEAAKEEMRNKAAAAHAEKNKDKPAAKTNMILDIKGWDDETDFVKLEELVRAIEMDGLLWGAAGLEDVGYGIKKLRITCVVEDDKVSVDELEEKITAMEDYVQSVDVASMQKI